MFNNSINNSTNLRSRTNTTVNSDMFYRSLFEHNPDMVFYLDIHGIIAKANGVFSKTIGYRQEEIFLSPFEQFFPASEISMYKELFKKALTGETQYTYTSLIHKNGNAVSIHLNIIPAIAEEAVIGIFGIAKDITDIQISEMELTESELKFSSIVEEALVGVYIIQEDGKVLYGNTKFFHVLGVDSKAEVNFRDYVHPEDISYFNSLGKVLINGEAGITHTFRMIKIDGTVLDIELHSKKVYFRNKPHVVGTLQDISERKKAAELNEYLANHDYLTDLPNQRLFYERLEQELIISKALQQSFTVMLLDLDRFKYVNDTLGHSVGNELLKAISKRLSICLGNDGVLARLGGDEFAILLPNIGDVNRVIEYAKTMIESLEDPFYIEKYELFVTASPYEACRFGPL